MSKFVIEDEKIMSEWDYEKNNGLGLDPNKITIASKKKAYFICKNGHSFLSRIDCASKEVLCPFCNGKKPILGMTDLATTNPNLIGEWDYKKNGDLIPTMFTNRNSTQIWWICSKKHSWKATIRNRSNGSGCPFCSGRNAIQGVNDLNTTHPNIAELWDTTKNGSISSSDVTFGSGKVVWWLCKFGHSYKKDIYSMVKHPNCPFCNGKILIKGENDFATIYKDLVKEWNYSKNEGISPYDYLPSSTKEVWWKCSTCGTEYFSSIYNRTKVQVGCPNCARKLRIMNRTTNHVNSVGSFESEYPYLLEEWNYSKNKKSPSEYTKGSNEKVWWKCSLGHEWETAICNRTIQHTGCPVCKKELHTSFPEQAIMFYLSKVIDVKSRFIILGKEADVYIPSKRIAIEYDGYRFHSNTKKNKYDEEKEIVFLRNNIRLIRIKDNREVIPCSIEGDTIYCHADQNYSFIKEVMDLLCDLIDINHIKIDIKSDYQKIMEQYISLAKENSLFIKNPKLASEWHPVKNGNLKPSQFQVSSSKTVWWLGACGHEWQAKISNRNRGKGCPFCNQYAVSHNNNLEYLYPTIASEWHPTKNGNLKPTDVLPGSNKKVWWLDADGNEWRCQVSTRTMYNTQAPQKKGNRVSESKINRLKENKKTLADTHYELVSNYWDYDNNMIAPNTISSGSHLKVYWICPICKNSFLKEIRAFVSQKIHCCKECKRGE